MRFNKYSHLEGRHASLGASKYHWINYTDEKFDLVFANEVQAQRGTDLHFYANLAIKLRQKQPKVRTTIAMYVNDAIGYRMTPEVVLRYSDNWFGTADAISFRDGLLRIHDLKTGMTKTSFRQLMVYAALFCLEYGFKPGEIQIELRIYQNDEVLTYTPLFEEIVHIMDQGIKFDRRINELREEAYL